MAMMIDDVVDTAVTEKDFPIEVVFNTDKDLRVVICIDGNTYAFDREQFINLFNKMQSIKGIISDYNF